MVLSADLSAEPFHKIVKGTSLIETFCLLPIPTWFETYSNLTSEHWLALVSETIHQHRGALLTVKTSRSAFLIRSHLTTMVKLNIGQVHCE